MSHKQNRVLHIIRNETALFLVLLLFGLVVLPVCIWFTGKTVFGAYGGAGYGEFFGALSGRIRSFDLLAWLLVLSPWLVWQVARLMLFGWRAVGKL